MFEKKKYYFDLEQELDVFIYNYNGTVKYFSQIHF